MTCGRLDVIQRMSDAFDPSPNDVVLLQVIASRGEQDDAIETFAWFASNASRDLISHCDVCAFMPTAIHQLDLPSTAKAVRIEVRVGAAHWTVDLDHRVLAALDCPSGEMEPETVHRVMENVRAKAVEMRWYGGGQISLEPSDLVLSYRGLQAPAAGTSSDRSTVQYDYIACKSGGGRALHPLYEARYLLSVPADDNSSPGHWRVQNLYHGARPRFRIAG